MKARRHTDRTRVAGRGPAAGATASTGAPSPPGRPVAVRDPDGVETDLFATGAR